MQGMWTCTFPSLYEKIEMDKQVREGLLESFLFGTRQKQTQTSLRGKLKTDSQNGKKKMNYKTI